MKKSYATMRRIRRNRIIAGVGSVLGVALVAGGAILLMNMTDASDELRALAEASVTTLIASKATASELKPSASLADPNMTATSNNGSVATSEAFSPETAAASAEAEHISQETTADTVSDTSVTSSSTTAADTAATTEETSATTTPEETTTTTTTAATITTSASDKLKSISDLPAGKVISSDKIDKSDLGKYFTSHKIEKGGAVYERINGKSYQKNDNISLSDLRYLKMLHVNFDGNYQVGEMIVNKRVASDVMEIFKTLCEKKYQIYSMRLIDDFWAGSGDKSDYASIDANNTSAFCYRKASGGGNLSKHALGLAIDINPQQNPYVTYKNGKAKFSHDNAADYVEDRSSDTPHVITKSDRAYKLFRAYGWTWGGSWSSPKDYQHFQLS